MAIDPDLAPILERLRALPALDTLTPIAARGLVNQIAAAAEPGPAIDRVVDTTIARPGGDLPVRIYAAVADPAATILYFHGGGWTVGTLEGGDPMLRDLAVATRAAIVSVDYRLAPEAPFPAAIDDAWLALTSLRALAAGSPDGPLIVAGDSAGANLAIVAAIMARDAGGPAIDAVAAFYPVTDADVDTDSYRANAEGYFLTRAMMRWFWAQYVPDAAARDDWRAAPLRCPDLAGLPPTLIQVAPYDPLRDDGVAMARRLCEAGNAVTLDERPGLIHGYVTMRQVPAARRAVAEAAVWIDAIVRGRHDPS